ncbi:aminotransferase-like domain-containing protein [Delftia acidovorans]
MLLPSPWTPRLARIEASAAERLARALADDIVEGRLAGGDRLPAHRDLADRLQIGLGSVTRAYALLERRGLTRSVKGRGTFVASQQAQAGEDIDLSSNAPPAAISARVLARTLTGIARSIDADHFNFYAPPQGHLEYRRVLVLWLQTLGLNVEPDHMVLTSSARQALSLAFDLVCQPRGRLLTERITYPGAIALARRKGYAMQGLAIDTQGLLPQALADALEGIPAAEGKVVYLTPTLHNPTTATMGAERRQAIVDICRSAGAWIIEDGVYAACLPDHAPLAHLATLAPEITLHVNGLSKSLGPGLQVGMLVLPASLCGAAVELVQEMSMAPSALSCAVIDEWLSHGVVASLQADLRHEAQRRRRLAASHLASHLSGSGLVLHPEAYNAWLPMEREAADRLVSAAAALGLKLTDPGSLMVDPQEQASGLRICLGAPRFDALDGALAQLARLLTAAP